MEQPIENLDGILGLGLNPQDLTLGQLLLRALIVCFVMYVMIGWRDADFLPKKILSMFCWHFLWPRWSRVPLTVRPLFGER